MKPVKAVAFPLAALLLAGSLAPAAAASNPLIGKWKLVKPDCEVMTQLEYTPTTYAGFEKPEGVYPGWHKLAVKYNVSATEVWVLVNGYASNQTRVFVIDANHIKPDDASGCIFERAR